MIYTESKDIKQNGNMDGMQRTKVSQQNGDTQ